MGSLARLLTTFSVNPAFVRVLVRLPINPSDYSEVTFNMASKLIAIVAGVGPGTGASVAKKFAAFYPVVLLARKPESYESLAKEINQGGGKAIGISTDVSDSKSVKDAVNMIKKEFGADVGAAVSGATPVGPCVH